MDVKPVLVAGKYLICLHRVADRKYEPIAWGQDTSEHQIIISVPEDLGPYFAKKLAENVKAEADVPSAYDGRWVDKWINANLYNDPSEPGSTVVSDVVFSARAYGYARNLPTTYLADYVRTAMQVLGCTSHKLDKKTHRGWKMR